MAVEAAVEGGAATAVPRGGEADPVSVAPPAAEVQASQTIAGRRLAQSPLIVGLPGAAAPTGRLIPSLRPAESRRAAGTFSGQALGLVLRAESVREPRNCRRVTCHGPVSGQQVPLADRRSSLPWATVQVGALAARGPLSCPPGVTGWAAALERGHRNSLPGSGPRILATSSACPQGWEPAWGLRNCPPAEACAKGRDRPRASRNCPLRASGLARPTGLGPSSAPIGTTGARIAETTGSKQ